MRVRFFAVLLTLLFAIPAFAAGDAGPRAVIDTFNARLLDVMKQADALGYAGRVEKLRPAVADAYDMDAMTQATLGVAAKKLTPEETEALVDAYRRYSVAIYADQFDGWDGEHFETDEPHPADGGLTLVPSRIVGKSGSSTAIDYLVHQTASGAWRIVDVLFDGTASQVAVRRSQFIPIFRKQGVTGLIEMLNSKTAAMGSK